MHAQQLSSPAPTLLVLADGADWPAAAQVEAARLGWPAPVVAAGPVEAVRCLVRDRTFSHLLLEPSAAGALLADLIGITAGETESGTELVLLGRGACAVQQMAGGGRAVVARQPHEGWLEAVCAALLAAARPTEPVTLAEALPVLASGQLHIRYQPVVSMADGTPFALEALARLMHPRLGLLAPDRFVAQIEDSGHAGYLAETVLQRAMSDWNGQRLARYGLRLAVNVPLDVLTSPGAPQRLDSLRERAGLNRDQLAIELTETNPIPSPAALRPLLAELRALGFRLAIDDVGPNTRDHAGLLDLPFTSLKLDKQLVANSERSAAALAMIADIVAEARQAGLLVIAEGVETEADWRRMAGVGVQAAQGYLVARPLTAAAVPIWMDVWHDRLHAGGGD